MSQGTTDRGEGCPFGVGADDRSEPGRGDGRASGGVSRGSLLGFVEDPGGVMMGLMRDHGELAVLEDEERRMVFAFGPEYVKRVLTDLETYHSFFFPLRGSKRSAQRRLTAGLLTMNGADYQKHRKVIAEPFQRAAIRGYQDAVRELVEELLEGWEVGGELDVFEAMTRFMLRVTCVVLFGVGHKGLAYEVGEMLASWVRMNHEVGMMALRPDTRSAEGYAALNTEAEALEAKVRELIAARRDEREGTDVLWRLLRGYDAEGMLDDTELVGQTAVLFGAAHMTTANTLTWTLVLLGLHPEVAARLLEEIEATGGVDVAGCGVGVGVPVDVPTARPYLEDVVRESMRLLPASGYSQRLTSRATELGGVSMERGTPVVFSQYVTHRLLTGLYPEPERFMPERWKDLRPGPYAYLPFGAGPRRCIGAQLALLVFRVALPRIVGRYRLELVEGREVSGRVTGTMLTPTGPVWARVHRQDGAFTRGTVTGNVGKMVRLA
ncbi:MAG: cytochrome P450 [Planctomycetota bacterium]